MDSKDDINKEVRNMESYIQKLKLTETKELHDNREIFFSNTAIDILDVLFKMEEDILNKQIKDLEDCKKEIKRWAAGGADVEAEIGVDRVNHFKNKEKDITNSLNALSGCVTNILTYLSTLNSSIQKLYGKRNAQNKMIYSLLKKQQKNIDKK